MIPPSSCMSPLQPPPPEPSPSPTATMLPPPPTAHPPYHAALTCSQTNSPPILSHADLAWLQQAYPTLVVIPLHLIVEGGDHG